MEPVVVKKIVEKLRHIKLISASSNEELPYIIEHF